MVLQAEGTAQTEAVRRAHTGPWQGRGSDGGQVQEGEQQEMAIKGKVGPGHMGP